MRQPLFLDLADCVEAAEAAVRTLDNRAPGLFVFSIIPKLSDQFCKAGSVVFTFSLVRALLMGGFSSGASFLRHANAGIASKSAKATVASAT